MCCLTEHTTDIILTILTVLITKQLHNASRWTQNQTDHVLVVRDGIQIYSMYDLSEELTVIMITVWWWQKLGKGWH
jgi:hypothetical protein